MTKGAILHLAPDVIIDLQCRCKIYFCFSINKNKCNKFKKNYRVTAMMYIQMNVDLKTVLNYHRRDHVV